MSQRLNVLISAYACRPHEGSEPGVGWNLVLELSKYHRIWVLTRGNNQIPIETELSQHPVPDLNFIYCEPSQILAKLNQKSENCSPTLLSLAVKSILGCQKIT